MARQPGSANFSGTIEALAGGPLDARSIVKTKADLTAVGSFEYPYIGMETYVVSENKKYRLIGDNPLVVANWEEIGSVILDEEIDETSENGVQNKVIAEALDGKADLDEDGKVVESQLRERELHQAEYDALTEEEKMNGTTYYIDDSIDEGSTTAVCGFTPIGTIISVMGTVAPRNYIACNGQVVNIDTYPELANYFEQQFGSKNKFGGDGVTTFGIPDLRGEFLRGTGTNSHYNTDAGIKEGNGAAVGTHQTSTTINAGFAYAGSINTGKLVIRGNANADGNLALLQNVDAYKISDGTATYKQVLTPAGTVQNSPNTAVQYGTVKPTNTSVLFCIAVRNIYVDARYDYSTDEKVVGTWIDGKPIYQKVIDCGVLPNTSQKSISTGISNPKMLIDAWGCCTNDTSTSQLIIPRILKDNQDVMVSYAPNLSEIRIKTESNRSTLNCYFFLRYTKTTD